MLSKVLKYDLKRQGNSMIYGYILVLILSLVTKILSFLESKVSVFSFLYSLSVFVFALSIVGIFLYYLLISIIRFYKDFASKEAYLLQMVPASKNTLILSKLITANIYLTITILVMLLALFINYYDADTINNITNFITNFLKQININGLLLLIYFIFAVILGNISNILMCYAAISLGQKHTNKLTYSFVYGLIIYVISQIISTIFVLILSIINPNINSVNISNSSIIQILVLSLILCVILSIIYYIITYKEIKNKLNV